MPKLVFRDSDGIDKSLDMGSEPILIGRAAECQVQTQDALVSRRHARIIWDGNYWIEDLGSSNGVFVAGEKVQRAPIRPGDEVRCGSLTLRVVPEVARSAASKLPSASSLAPPAAPPPSAPLVPPPAAPPMDAYGAPPPAPPLEQLQTRARQPSGNVYSTVPAPAAPPPPVVEPNALLEQERARRVQAEAAVLTAEQRAAAAAAELVTAQNRVQALEQRLADAEAASGDGGDRAGSDGKSEKEGAALQRKVDQLTAELRRLRGGSLSDDFSSTEPGVNPSLIADLASERDKLRARVAELEAAAAGAPTGAAGGDADLALARRKVEQLTAENRRLRGGQPAPPDDERVAALEGKVAAAERERDEAVRKAAEASSPSAAYTASVGEIDKLKRMIDQLNAENRRLRQGAGPSSPPPAAPVAVEDPRVAELGARLAKAEAERDALKNAPAVAAPAGTITPALGEAVGGVDDALADLRGSLRAAHDEVGVLGVESPGDSVTVLRDALNAATEQLETARTKLRDVRGLAGVK